MAESMHPAHAAVRAIVGDDHVVFESTALDEYRRDRGPFPELSPGLAVRPGSLDEVVATVQAANRLRTPIVTRGGGWSLTGFPPRVAPGEALVLDMRRLNRVLTVDRINMTVRAECGIVLSDLERQLQPMGMEISSVAVPIRHTTLGGMLSGVVGGGLSREAAIYGTNAHQTIGLTLVLGTGEVLRTNAGGSNYHRDDSYIGDGDGPILTPLFIGDGGALGVKVDATLQMRPSARLLEADAWFLPDFDSLVNALSTLMNLREPPYTSMRAGEGPYALSFIARADEAIRLESQLDEIRAVIRAAGGTPGTDEMRRAALGMATADPAWTDRFDAVSRSLIAFIVGRRDFPHAYSRVRRFIDDRFAERELADMGMRVLAFFRPHTRHAVYATISLVFDDQRPGSRLAAAALTADAYRLVSELGGHSEAHQGTGSVILGESWSPPYRRLVSGIKSQVDPHGILNPGLWGFGTPQDETFTADTEGS